MPSDKRCVLFAFFLLVVQISSPWQGLIQHTDSLRIKQGLVVYMCPPCGCPADELISNQPGICIHCGMTLSAVDTTRIISQNSIFICPPCGCRGDHLFHADPGNCPHCSMQLIEVQRDLTGAVALKTKYLFQNARVYSPYYIRVVYPLILMTILLGLAHLFKEGMRPPHIFVTSFLFALALYMLKFQLYGEVYSLGDSQFSLFVPISFLLWVWPSLYFYVKMRLTKWAPENRLILIHITPALISFGAQLILFIGYPSTSTYLYNHFDTPINTIEQIIFSVSGFWYLSKVDENSRRLVDLQNAQQIRRQLRVIKSFMFLASTLMLCMLLLNFM